MGGKLFNLPRMAKAEYLERESSIRAYLDQKLQGQYRIPRFYSDKPDFGDMDIIVPQRENWKELRLEIKEELGIEQHRTIGHVFSTVYQGLQTDFFTVPQRYLDSTYNFMSFNDLGNFLGRIVRRFNLKYGEQGLCYVFRRESEGHYKRDLEVSQDFSKICTFLGLDYAQWVQGFESLESLYRWVIQSPYFSVAPYDDMEGHLEKRSKERTTVMRFVEWLKIHNVSNRPEFGERHSYLGMVMEFFSEAKLDQQIAEEQKMEARALAFASKFNGKLVMRLLPHLEGKALGEFMVGFKQSIKDFESFVLGSELEEIERRILEYARNIRKK